MTNLEQFLEQLATPAYIGIALLMFSTFLIGYFFGSYGMKVAKKKKIKELKQKINSYKVSDQVKDIETIFTEIKPKIIQVVKEQQKQSTATALLPEISIEEPENVISKTRSAYVKYNVSAPSLDFEDFGFGDKYNKDALTEIDGIGPYIEQKLNEIGIYNFDQISRLQIKDIRILTSLIDFFPGRIERDNWVGQAKDLLKIKN